MMPTVYSALPKLLENTTPYATYCSADEKQIIQMYSCSHIDALREDGEIYSSDQIVCLTDKDYGKVYFYYSLRSIGNYYSDVFEDGMGSSIIEELPYTLRQQVEMNGNPQDISKFLGRGFLKDLQYGEKVTIESFDSLLRNNMLPSRKISWTNPSVEKGIALLNDLLPLFTFYTYESRNLYTTNYDISALAQEADDKQKFVIAIQNQILKGFSIKCCNHEYVLTKGEDSITWDAKVVSWEQSEYRDVEKIFFPDEIKINGQTVNRSAWVQEALVTSPDAMNCKIGSEVNAIISLIYAINSTNLGRTFSSTSYSNCDISYSLTLSDQEWDFNFEHCTTSGTTISCMAHIDNSNSSNFSSVTVSIPSCRCYPGRYHYGSLLEFYNTQEQRLKEAGFTVTDNNLEIPDVLANLMNEPTESVDEISME